MFSCEAFDRWKYYFRTFGKNMETNNIPCATCKMGAKYDKNPKSLIARF